MPRTPLITGETCRGILLAMSQPDSGDDVLQTLVNGLSDRCGAALARVWLVIPKEQCEVCRKPELCAVRPECLKLAASAGRSLAGTDWSGVSGRFAHFPFTFGKVGHIAETRMAVEEKTIDSRSPWIAEPQWVKREKIRGFIGQPLLHQDKLLGVLAVFTRQSPTDDDLAWLRAFADHAAVAVANSQAMVEIQELRGKLEVENEYLRTEVKAAQSNGEINGVSPVVQNLLSRIKLVAPTDATVLIQGESGTGKELVARAIHEQSQRSRQPMITVNCAAIPRELFESEFFGHIKGSFSGATHDRLGRFQLANGGTLLLDEVGEIPLAMQGKLLRILEQGTFERVGDERTQRVDVRVVAATNRNLGEEVSRGRFRKDLYYRLSVFLIEVAPLRERPEDIAVLARHFLAIYSRKYRLKEPRLARDQAEQLQSYAWPGNVRELRNVVERAVIMLASKDAHDGLDFSSLAETGSDLPPERSPAASGPKLLTDRELRELERSNLIAVLKHTKWKVSGPGGAATFLGVKPGTLSSRLRALNIARSQSEHDGD